MSFFQNQGQLQTTGTLQWQQGPAPAAEPARTYLLFLFQNQLILFHFRNYLILFTMISVPLWFQHNHPVLRFPGQYQWYNRLRNHPACLFLP